MNKGPNRPTMILNLFREGERFADKATDSLPQRIVNALTMRRSAGFFVSWTMAFAGQNDGIGGQEIGVHDRTLAIDRRE